MATTILTVNPQKITVPANANDHDINFDDMMISDDFICDILIDNISGPMRFNCNGTADASISGVYTTTDKLILKGVRQKTLHYRGASGSETFQITILM